MLRDLTTEEVHLMIREMNKINSGEDYDEDDMTFEEFSEQDLK